MMRPWSRRTQPPARPSPCRCRRRRWHRLPPPVDDAAAAPMRQLAAGLSRDVRDERPGRLGAQRRRGRGLQCRGGARPRSASARLTAEAAGTCPGTTWLPPRMTRPCRPRPWSTSRARMRPMSASHSPARPRPHRRGLPKHRLEAAGGRGGRHRWRHARSRRLDRARRVGIRSLESVLLGIGVLLAVVGGVLLLLTWLSRRAADPLLR